jgi:hypothetical protein
MKRMLVVLACVLLSLSVRSSAQFTIPNNGTVASNNQSIPMQADFDILSAAIQSDAVVVYGCAVTAQGAPNMTVAVAVGSVRIDGLIVAVAAGNVTITAAHASLPRIDLITVNTSGTKAAVAGDTRGESGNAGPASGSSAARYGLRARRRYGHQQQSNCG